jgi:hypothetical protein
MPVAKHLKSHPTTLRDIRVIRGRTDPSPGPAHSNATFLIVALHGEPEGRADDALNPGCGTGELGWAAFPGWHFDGFVSGLVNRRGLLIGRAN